MKLKMEQLRIIKFRKTKMMTMKNIQQKLKTQILSSINKLTHQNLVIKYSKKCLQTIISN